MLNQINIMGRLTADLEIKTTASGISVTSFSIACDRNRKEGDTYPTDFFDVVAWRTTAEFVCKHFSKGDMIAISGTLQTRSYVDKSNNNRKVTEIIADSVYFCGGKNGERKNNTAVATAPPANNNAYRNAGNQAANYAAPGKPNVQVPNYKVDDGEFNNTPDDFYPEFG